MWVRISDDTNNFIVKETKMGKWLRRLQKVKWQSLTFSDVKTNPRKSRERDFKSLTRTAKINVFNKIVSTLVSQQNSLEIALVQV